MLGKLNIKTTTLTNDELLDYSKVKQDETNFLEIGSVFQTAKGGGLTALL